MFASKEHKVRVEIKVDIENNPIHMHMLHKGKHRVKVKIKVDIENSRQTISLAVLKQGPDFDSDDGRKMSRGNKLSKFRDEIFLDPQNDLQSERVLRN